MKTIEEVEQICRRMRINIIRMIERAGSGHPGGSLSCVEIIATLCFLIMRIDPKDPYSPGRDIFVLSKSHAAATLYTAMHESGLVSLDELKTFREFKSRLQGHASSFWLPGVEFSAGLLGQGLSFANGRALRAKLEGNKRLHFVLLGEGDLHEGQTWEAAQTASHHHLGNVIAFADLNGFVIDKRRVLKVKNLEPLSQKWTANKWLVFEADGHNVAELRYRCREAIERSSQARLPSIILTSTVKGKGVSFMEGNNDFHGRAPTKEEALKALAELGGGEELWQRNER